MRATQILAANLTRLMAQPGNPSSGPAVDRVASGLGLRIGRTTVTRITHGDANPSLEHIEVLAKVFEVQPWQLLHPSMGNGWEASTAAGPAVPRNG